VSLVVCVPLSAELERRYVIGVVLGDWLGLRHEIVREERTDVAVSDTCGEKRLVLADIFLATPCSRWLRPDSLPSVPLAEWSVPDGFRTRSLVDDRLPLLFGDEVAPGSYVQVGEAGVKLGLDVFGSVFFMISRYEEVVSDARDHHGRFPDTEALSVRAGFAERPLANEYVEVLWASLQRLWPRLERRRRTFRFLPSHDVDRALCRESSHMLLARRLGADLLVRRSVDLATTRLRAYRRGCGNGHEHDLCDTYELLMELSERANTISAFHFFGERTGHDLDATYAPSDPAIRNILRQIGERGHEIALHASYDAHYQSDVVRRQLKGLQTACCAEGVERAAWGNRHHYFRWEAPNSWQALEDAGVSYDATVGFAQTVGFRAGCCYEFPVFNLLTRTALKLRERPLVAMEVALLDRLKLSHEETLGRLSLLKERCKRFDGDFTLLWHNSRLQTRVDRETYETVLTGPISG
jgi:hypothetical protein